MYDENIVCELYNESAMLHFAVRHESECCVREKTFVSFYLFFPSYICYRKSDKPIMNRKRTKEKYPINTCATKIKKKN